jgi:hypothetical protein
MAERRFTDLELERSLAGELQLAQATEADRARLSELRDVHAAYLASVDLDNEVKRIQQRVEREAPQRRAWWRWAAPIGTIAAAAAALLIVLKVRGKTEQAPDELTTKGSDIALVIHVATEGGSRPLASGDTVAPGARLRFEVPGTRSGYIAVVGVDSTGGTTVYYPFGGAQAAPLGLERLLPGAIQLDASAGDEHFFALFSAQPFAIPQTVAALPAGLVSSEVVLHKK